MSSITIGVAPGTSYTPGNGTRDIAIEGIPGLKIEQLKYVFNYTQNRPYYSPVIGLGLCSIVGSSIRIHEDFPVLASTDKIHIQLDDGMQNRSYKSEENSTEVALGIDGAFTGEWILVKGAAVIQINIHTDKDSATDGLQIQWSDDGVEVIDGMTDKYSISADSGKVFRTGPNASYMRAYYLNGSEAQGEMHLGTIIYYGYVQHSSHRIQDTLSDEDDAQLVVAIPKLRTAQNNYVSAGATAAGNSKISLEEYNGEIAEEGLPVIESDHHWIHEEIHYEVDSYVDLAINNVYDLQITTPDTVIEPHLTFQLYCENETLVQFYENVTIATPGTAITTPNNNRRSANTATLLVKGILNADLTAANADTVVSGATLLKQGIVGAGRSAGAASRSRELILARNKNYTLRIIASVAGFTDFLLTWYEK